MSKELLPTTDGTRAGSGPQSMWRPRGCLKILNRPFRRAVNLVLLVSESLALFSWVSIQTYNSLYLETEVKTASPYNPLISKLWPVRPPARTDNWEDENNKSLHALVACMSTNTCRENQTSIVLLTSPHLTGAIEGKVSGENIWGISIIEALRQMGYTYIYTAPNDNTHLAQTYRQFPDLVKVIILQGHSIPAWKMLSFAFWQGPENPLGSAWTLSPENYPAIYPSTSKDNVYLGYSVEHACLQIPAMPVEERPRQAYVLAKDKGYFGKEYAWPEVAFDKPSFDVHLVAGLVPPRNASMDSETPKGITDLGRLNKTEFYHNLGKSRVLIGIGKPKLSPSPYDALCMGVPFINPVTRWEKNDPENRMRWATQHDSLKFENPPYVYNVKTGDPKRFWDAVRQAIDTPIERHIIPEMAMEALKYRLGKIIEDDWRGKAERVLEERKASKSGQIS